MTVMEDWQLDFEWHRVRHYVKEALTQADLPDLQIILLLIGVQETNAIQSTYTKEEKQDLMHVATCELLSIGGYFEFIGKDADGWPHYKQVRRLQTKGESAQERLLKEYVIQYFNLSTIDSQIAHEN